MKTHGEKLEIDNNDESVDFDGLNHGNYNEGLGEFLKLSIKEAILNLMKIIM